VAKEKCASALRWWERLGQAKIAVKVDNDEHMHTIERVAQSEGLVTCIIRDAGHTQIAPGSKTVLAIGPAPDHVLKAITGKLKLL
jgi:PTH2 family peptidyl-tRNA hydrolase